MMLEELVKLYGNYRKIVGKIPKIYHECYVVPYMKHDSFVVLKCITGTIMIDWVWEDYLNFIIF